MSNPFDEFRRTVFGPHNRKPWGIRLRDTLRFLSLYPQYQQQVGLIPDGQNGFFVNSQTCAIFFGLKNRNSFNRNLQQHGFDIDHTSNITDQHNFLSSELISAHRCWTKRVCTVGDFNGQTSTLQTELASNHARQIRNGITSIDQGTTVPGYSQIESTNAAQPATTTPTGGFGNETGADQSTQGINVNLGMRFEWDGESDFEWWD
jgi:hypothetical protein